MYLTNQKHTQTDYNIILMKTFTIRCIDEPRIT